jgi:Leucine-rich repeat (LRR) protein
VQTQKKVQIVELTPSSLYLSYNKLRSIKGFYAIVDSVFPAIQNLKWIDLSHNQLVILDYVHKFNDEGLQRTTSTSHAVLALQLH